MQNMKLSMKLGIVFVILLILNAASYMILSSVIVNMRSDAATINLAGIQRMNAERLLRLAQHVPRGHPEIRHELLLTMQQYDHNLQLLRWGNDVIQAPMPDSEAGLFLQDKINVNWLKMQRYMYDLVELTGNPHHMHALLESIKQLYDTWSVDINHFVSIIQMNSTEKVKRLQQLELAIVLINVCVVIIALWAVIRFITRPLTQLIGKMNQLADGHYRLMPLAVDRKDEIGLLSKSFNSMLQSLLIRKDVISTGEMQRRLLPTGFENEWVKVSVVYHPWQYVSGDFVDFIWDDLRNRLFGFVIDIMGHGMTSAMQFGAIRVLLRQQVQQQGTLDEKMIRVNQQAIRYFSEGSFAAVICFELEQDGRLTYASGGINHFIMHRQGQATFVPSPGNVLGLLEDAEFEQHRIKLEPGANCIFASDGLLELISEKEVTSCNFEHYIATLQQQAERRSIHDDISAICIQYRGQHYSLSSAESGEKA